MDRKHVERGRMATECTKGRLTVKSEIITADSSEKRPWLDINFLRSLYYM